MPEHNNSSSPKKKRNPLEIYYQLPEPLKKQMAKISDKLEGDSEIKKETEKMYSKMKHNKHNLTSAEIKKIAQRLAVLKAIPPEYLLEHENFWPHVSCYDDKGHQVTLKKVISKGRHVVVLEGLLDNEIPVVVKWYESDRRDTSYEISIYTRLRKMKECQTPWFSSTYKFWDFPVLVMEKLDPLQKEDDEFAMAKDVLEQLITMHKFGVHNDIKPGNVCVRRLKDGSCVYLVIDFGGFTMQKLSYGYLRWIWSPKWTSQKPHGKNQVTTAKNDFIELVFTLKTMQNWRTGDDKIRTGFTGYLAKMWERVEQVDPRNIKLKDYQDLIDICLVAMEDNKKKKLA